MRSDGVIHCIDVAASAASGLPLSPLEALVSSGFRLEPSEQPPHGVTPWQGGLRTECRCRQRRRRARERPGFLQRVALSPDNRQRRGECIAARPRAQDYAGQRMALPASRSSPLVIARSRREMMPARRWPRLNTAR